MSSRSKTGDIGAFFAENNDLLENVIRCIKNSSFHQFPDANQFIRGFGGVYGFSELFQLWLDEQMQVVLLPKKVKSNIPGIPEERTGVGSNARMNSIAATLPDASNSSNRDKATDSFPTPERESDVMLRILGATMRVKQKKPKKRLVPTAVPSSCIQASEPTLDLNLGISSRNQLGSVSVVVPVENALSADVIPAQSGDAFQYPVLESGCRQTKEDSYTEKKSEISPEKRPPPPPIQVESGIAPLRIGSLLTTSTQNNSDPNEGKLSVTEVQKLVNIAAVYSALVVHLYIPFAVGIPFLGKLLGATAIPTNPMRLMVSAKPAEFVFRTIIHIHVFAAKAVEISLPLLGHLGPDLALELANSAAVCTYCPEAARLLRSLADDASSDRGKDRVDESRSNGRKDESMSVSYNDVSGRDTFIRPFHADVDDRNLYKTQSENTIFNEREKLYDEISELYRKYQDTVSSDLDGSKVEEFWKHMSRVCMKIISGLRDCNISWFADLIMQMLLHYGANIPTVAPAHPFNNAVKTSVEGAKTDAKMQEGDTFTSSSMNDKSMDNSSSTKQRLLEARMGTAGIGQSNSFNRGANRVIRPTSSSGSSAISKNGNIGSASSSGASLNFNRGAGQSAASSTNVNNYTNFTEPALLFPGNQQFFFRFCIQCDSYRLNQYLKLLMWEELEFLTERALCNFANGDSFTLCVCKLSILGRFLGLLQFSPHWVLSVPKDSLDSGPLRHLMERISDMRKNKFAANGLGAVNLLEIVQQSIREKYFCLTIPWVSEFLKLMAWDSMIPLANSHTGPIKVGSTSGAVHQELACVQYLVALLFADRQILERETMSSNRVYVLLVLESFVGSLPNSLRHIDRKTAGDISATGGLTGAPFPTSIVSPNFSNVSTMHHILDLDDKNWAFLKPAFSDLLAPFISRTLRYLRHPRGSVMSRSRSTSAASLQTPSALPPPPPLSGSLRIMSSTSISSIGPVALEHTIALGNIKDASEILSTRPLGSPQLENWAGLDMPTFSNVSRALFCSSPQGESSKGGGKAAFETFKVAVNSERKLPEPLHFVEPISESPSPTLSKTIPDIRDHLSQSPPTLSFQEYFNRDIGRSDVGHRMIGFSPATLAETINSTNATVGNGNNTVQPATPTSHSQPPSLVLTPSLSRQLSSAGKSTGVFLPSEKKRVERRLQQRLELAFWRQHDNLFQMSRFFLDQLENGLKLQLKEIRVADAIHQAWGVSDRLKTEMLLNFKNSLCAAECDAERNTETVLANAVNLFKAQLHNEVRRIHKETMLGASAFADRTSGDFFTSAFPQLLRLYPSNEAVIAMALHLIRDQVDSETRSLIVYLESYSMRKLDDVCRVSCAQFARLLDKETPKKGTIVKISDTSYSSGIAGVDDSLKESSCILLRRQTARGVESSVFSRKLECFSACILKAMKLVDCSSLHSVSFDLNWEELSIREYLFKLNSDLADGWHVDPCKERNMVGNVCSLISNLLTVTCELMVFDIEFSEVFVSKVSDWALLRGTAASGWIVLQRSFITSQSGQKIDSINGEENVAFAIQNIVSLCSVLLEYLQLLIDAHDGNDTTELLGVIHVEVMKMLSVTMSTLMYLDALLFCALRADMGTLESRAKWPSNIALAAVRHRFINNIALGRVIVGACKPTEVYYHESWKNYKSMKVIAPPFLLYFVYRFVATCPHWRMLDRFGESFEPGKVDAMPLSDVAKQFDVEFVEAILKSLHAQQKL